ncbi:MAG: hypothetical protein PHR16_16740 [Methylovulum sp.]|nr:hypothetical protein [Methylovulum sp.]
MSAATQDDIIGLRSRVATERDTAIANAIAGIPAGATGARGPAGASNRVICQMPGQGAGGADDAIGINAAIVSARSHTRLAGVYKSGVQLMDGLYGIATPIEISDISQAPTTYPNSTPHIFGEGRGTTLINANAAMAAMIMQTGQAYPAHIEKLYLNGLNNASTGLQISGGQSNGVFRELQIDNVNTAISKIIANGYHDGDFNAFYDIYFNNVLTVFYQNTTGGYNQKFDHLSGGLRVGGVYFDIDPASAGGVSGTDLNTSVLGTVESNNSIFLRFGGYLNVPMTFERGRSEWIGQLMRVNGWGNGTAPTVKIDGMRFTTCYQPTHPNNTLQGFMYFDPTANGRNGLGYQLRVIISMTQFQACSPLPSGNAVSFDIKAASQANVDLIFDHVDWQGPTRPYVDPLVYISGNPPAYNNCTWNGAAFSG